jgi:hypothetical protein
MSDPKLRQRVEDHLQRLRKAGLDPTQLADALVELRDDPLLTTPQREAIYNLLATESFVWYLEALRGGAVDREKLKKEVKAQRDRRGAAVKAPQKGELAAELLVTDILKT